MESPKPGSRPCLVGLVALVALAALAALFWSRFPGPPTAPAVTEGCLLELTHSGIGPRAVVEPRGLAVRASSGGRVAILAPAPAGSLTRATVETIGRVDSRSAVAAVGSSGSPGVLVVRPADSALLGGSALEIAAAPLTLGSTVWLIRQTDSGMARVAGEVVELGRPPGRCVVAIKGFLLNWSDGVCRGSAWVNGSGELVGLGTTFVRVDGGMEVVLVVVRPGTIP